jgi:hypothetical protein
MTKYSSWGETLDLATGLVRKALQHHRDAARPKPDADTWSRKARHFQYLVDRGVSPETLAKEISDPIGLRIAQEELPLLARGQNPLDPQAGDAVAALLESKAVEVYGGTYKSKADELAQLEKGAYRSRVALAATIRHLREDGLSGELSVPSFQDGQLIEV